MISRDDKKIIYKVMNIINVEHMKNKDKKSVKKIVKEINNNKFLYCTENLFSNKNSDICLAVISNFDKIVEFLFKKNSNMLGYYYENLKYMSKNENPIMIEFLLKNPKYICWEYFRYNKSITMDNNLINIMLENKSQFSYKTLL